MAANMTVANRPLWRGIRWVVWGGAACLLLLPLVAMQFTSEVDWTLSDFVVMGALLALVGGAYELVVRVARSNTYVVASGVAVATAFVTIWINLAVGIIGGEDNRANLMFVGVLAIALIGAVLARLEPLRMARAAAVTAAVQALVGVAALFIAPDQPEGVILSGILAASWYAAAYLFRIAARDQQAALTRPAG